MTDQTPANQLPTPPWLLATTADLETLDFEAPIAASTAANTNELSYRF